MRRSSRELKRMARQNLCGHYRVPMGAFAVAGALSFAVELPFSMMQTDNSLQLAVYYIAELLISLITVVLTAGQMTIHLNMARGKAYNVSQVFCRMKNHPDRFVIAGFGVLVVSALALAPMMIGVNMAVQDPVQEKIITAIGLGLISLVLETYISIRLSLLYYVILENDGLSLKECLGRAMELMNGNMGRMFYLQLSFIGMYFLVGLTLGIGVLWVMPYIMQTETLFYLEVTGKLPEESVCN